MPSYCALRRVSSKCTPMRWPGAGVKPSRTRSRVALEAVAIGVELAELIAGRDRRDAAALLVAERERVVPGTDRAARADVAAKRVIAADLGRRVRPRRAFAAAREDLDDAADRVGAVQARRRAAQDLDAIDLRQAEAPRTRPGRASPSRRGRRRRGRPCCWCSQPRMKKPELWPGPPLRTSCMPATRRIRSSTESALVRADRVGVDDDDVGRAAADRLRLAGGGDDDRRQRVVGGEGVDRSRTTKREE